jgi:hypothetical protein
MYDDFISKKPLSKYLRNYPKRLKNEGTELGKFYNELALSTIGHVVWEQMKHGHYECCKLNCAAIPDEYFHIFEILAEQLETYDHDEKKEEGGEIGEKEKKEESGENEQQPSKKQKEKRDRRAKIQR